MNEHDTLQALAAEYRRRFEARPPEWELVAAGKLSAREALEQIRARQPLDDAQAEPVLALFAPIGEDIQRRLAARLSEQVREELARSGPVPKAAPEDLLSDDDEAPATGTVARPPASVWSRHGVTIGVVAAAAAALVLFLQRPSLTPSATPTRTDAAIMLPGYEASVRPGAATMRAGETDGATRLSLAGDFDVLLRPASRHEHPARATLCLERVVEHHRLAVEQLPGAPGEALEVRARIPADLEPGAWTLVSIVAAVGDADCTATDAPERRVVRTPVELGAD
jgi:hypothetical protein